MKILYVTHQFFPDYKAGTEVLARSTAKKMQSYGHKVAFFTGFPEREKHGKGAGFDSYVFEGIPVSRFKHVYEVTEDQKNIVEQEYNSRKANKYFKQTVDQFKPDIVHVFHFQRVTASILNVCYHMNIPVVYSPTDFWLVCPTTQLLLPDGEICSGSDSHCANCLKHLSVMRLTGWKKKICSSFPIWGFSLIMSISQHAKLHSSSALSQAKALSQRASYLRTSLKQVNKILIPNQIMKHELKTFLGGEQNFVDLPFGIDLPSRIEKKESIFFRIGFIGTFLEHKGAHILTQAVLQLPRDLPIQVRMYGDALQFPDYSSQIITHADSDERIQLMGTFPLERINEVFSQLDVLVIPSIWHENTPLCVYAAKAYACPVISSRIAGMLDWINDGKDGMFFSPKSVSELAGILELLCRDRRKVIFMSENTSPPYAMERYLDKLSAIYSGFKGED